MAYHTGIYLLLFLPAVLLLYQLTPKKSRWITLLAAGYLFFWICSGKLVLYLLGTTLFTHYIAVWISWIKTKCNDETAGMQRTEAGTIKKAYKKKEKAILVFGICVLLGILAYLKYYNFFIQNVNVLLAQGGSSLALGTKQMLIPVGISFYTLQAIGYIGKRWRCSGILERSLFFWAFFHKLWKVRSVRMRRQQIRYLREIP